MRHLTRGLGVIAVAAIALVQPSIAAPVQVAQAALDLSSVTALTISAADKNNLDTALQGLATAQQSGDPTQIAAAQAALTTAVETVVANNPTQAAAIAGAAATVAPGQAAAIAGAAATAAPDQASAIAVSVVTAVPTSAAAVVASINVAVPGSAPLVTAAITPLLTPVALTTPPAPPPPPPPTSGT